MPHDQDIGAVRGSAGVAHPQRLDAKRLQGAHHAESGIVVVCQDLRGNDAAVARRQGNGFRLEDQIANGQREAVRIDGHRISFAPCAERFGGPRVFGDLRRQFQNRVEDIAGVRTRRTHRAHRETGEEKLDCEEQRSPSAPIYAFRTHRFAPLGQI